MKALGDLAPKFSIGVDSLSSAKDDLHLKMPFRRSWVAILISGAFLLGFSIPLYTTGASIVGESDGGLFSLIFVLFTLFWMLGWSTAVAILAIVFLVLAFGRETLRVSDNRLVFRIGLLGIGFGACYRSELIRNFRRESPDDKSGTSWRGEHLAFDYAGETIGFGSAIGADRAQQMLLQLKQLFPQQSSPLPKLSTLDTSANAEMEQPAAVNRETPPPDIPGIERAGALGMTSISSLALVAANLIPLMGVLFDDWSITEIMLLFWAESAVIGFYTLCKMIKIGGWTVLFYGPFFVGHYGGFMVGHLLFIYGLFGSDFASNSDIPTSEVFQDFVRLAPALAALFISHGISYFSNFLRRREYLGKEIAQQMGQPYRRIIIMHVTIIFGGFLVLAFGSPLPALLMLILLKLIADLRSHLVEHSPKDV